jgi:hypothetical protein
MRIVTMAAAVAVAAAVAMTSLATASASPTTARLGAAQTIEDRSYDPDNGNVEGVSVTSYTVSNLQPSNDVVNAPLAGRLWEATVTVNVVQGQDIVAPVIPFFNARSPGGDNYRVLYQMAAPNGLVPVLPPGGQATGNIYFDVTGPPPTEVVYNDVLQDLWVWN